jgi:hypothetical protein
MRASWWLGFFMWFAIWLGGTIAIFASEKPGWVFCITIGVALVVATIKNISRQQRIDAFVNDYVARYGAPPPGFSTRNTGIGYAAGAFGGHPNAGGLIGAGLDLFRMHREQQGMSEEQKALHDQIRGLQAWSPLHSVYMVAIWLGLSFAAAWVVDIAKPKASREPAPEPDFPSQPAAQQPPTSRADYGDNEQRDNNNVAQQPAAAPATAAMTKAEKAKQAKCAALVKAWRACDERCTNLLFAEKRNDDAVFACEERCQQKHPHPGCDEE